LPIAGINDAGQIVGYYFDDASGHQHGFLYSGGIYITLDDPSATNGTFAQGINNAGQIVGYYSNATGTHGFLLTISPNPPAPAGTTADLILRGSNSSPYAMGQYEIYDIGSNSLLAAYQLGTVGTDWQFVGRRPYYGGSVPSDMVLRSASTGGFELYDISNNQITGAAFLGTVGMDWQVMGFGNFSSLSEADMILRNVNNGGVEVYDIANHQIANAAFMGTVGLNWQFSGVGNFSSVAGETDLLLRNVNNGGLEVYNINNNQLTGAAFIGTIGLDWQYAGIAPIHFAGASDLVLRNVNSGAFEVYDIANNQLTGAASLGAVGLDWQLGGFAADPPSSSGGAFADVASDQLVQAMAGFGGGSSAGEGSNVGVVNADATQQPLLTAAQHS
jgi:probable HAF family extracellular repeat protein